MRNSMLPVLFCQERNLIGAEVGVNECKHTESLLTRMELKKLYLIDPWENYPDYEYETSIHHKLKKAKRATYDFASKYNAIEIIEKYSVDAAEDIKDGSLDFVYIDANHTYPYVLQDIEVWTPKVRSSGIVSGHDHNYYEVANAVKDYCEKNGRKYKYEAEEWWFIK